MTKLVKTVFVIIACVTLATFLYRNLFGFRDNKGGVYYALQASEEPIAKYYDKYGRQPAELWDKVRADDLIGSSDNVDTMNQTTILDEASIKRETGSISY